MTPAHPNHTVARRVLPVLLVVAGVLAAGCSDGEDADAPTTTRRPVAWADQKMPSLMVPAAVEDDLSVLESYIDGSAMKDVLARRDDAVVACLVDRGYDVKAKAVDTTPPATDMDISRGDFARRWGFGQVAPLQANGGYQEDFSKLSVGSGIVADGPVPPGAEFGGVPGPSLDFSKLTPDQKTSIVPDLLGSDFAISADGSPLPEPSPGQPACLEVANEQEGLVPGEGPLAAASDLRDQAKERIVNDAEIIDAGSTYAACMAAEGFNGLDTPASAATSITNEFGTLRDQAFNTVGTGELPNADTVGPDLVQRFQELGTREVAVAVANLECEAPYRAEVDQRSADIQQQVIDDNAALVSQLGGS